MDTWREIEEFPNYLINRQGEVLNHDTMRVLRDRTNKQGFRMVSLVRDRVQDTRSVALLVARAFLESPNNEQYNSVIHLDGDRWNCDVDNLMWRPRWFAMLYHKMFDHDPYNLSVYLVDTKETFETLREACVKYGLIESHVYEAINNHTPTFHYGFMFERIEEQV